MWQNILAAGIEATNDMITTGINNAVNWNIAQENLAYQRETNAQNERLMREGWARDDSSRQRMVEDLEKAGLSKWLATGTSPMSSSPIQLQSPHNDFKMNLNADALSHAYENYLRYEQTEKQNNILDKQGEIAQNNVEESEAKARIAQHDAKVFENRADVASTDPAYLKYISETINTLTGKNNVGKSVQEGLGSLADSVTKAREERKQAKAEKKAKKAKEKKEKRIARQGYDYEKPLSMSQWFKTHQIKPGSQEAVKAYWEYVNNFNKSRR